MNIHDNAIQKRESITIDGVTVILTAYSITKDRAADQPHLYTKIGERNHLSNMPVSIKNIAQRYMGLT